MDRRSFMNLFTAGATIVPLANSSIAATLIEPARVELAEAPKVEPATAGQLRQLEDGQMRITVDLHEVHKSFDYASKSFMLWVDTAHGVIQLRDTAVRLPNNREAGFHVDLMDMQRPGPFPLQCGGYYAPAFTIKAEYLGKRASVFGIK